MSHAGSIAINTVSYPQVQNTFLNNSLRCSNYLANRCQLSKIIHYTHANILICVRFAIVKTQGNIF